MEFQYRWSTPQAWPINPTWVSSATILGKNVSPKTFKWQNTNSLCVTKYLKVQSIVTVVKNWNASRPIIMAYIWVVPVSVVHVDTFLNVFLCTCWQFSIIMPSELYDHCMSRSIFYFIFVNKKYFLFYLPSTPAKIWKKFGHNNEVSKLWITLWTWAGIMTSINQQNMWYLCNSVLIWFMDAAHHVMQSHSIWRVLFS